MTSKPTILQCLLDKSYAPYQRSPGFAELIAILQKFGKLLNVTPFGFAELESALEYEADNINLDSDHWKHSEVLKKFYLDVLKSFNFHFTDYVSTEISMAVLTLLRRWKETRPYFSFDVKILDEDRDICQLSSTDKLSIMVIFLNAMFYKLPPNAIEMKDPDSLRITPLFIDSKGNKLWYFGDVYLFLEVKKKGASRKAPSNLFEGDSLALVCRTSEDWNNLMQAYTRGNPGIAAILAEKVNAVRAIENSRLKEAMRATMTIRTSSRLQIKMEESKRLQEENQRRKALERERIELETKQILEQNDIMEKAKALDEILEKRREIHVNNRKERQLQRELRAIRRLAKSSESRSDNGSNTKAKDEPETNCMDSNLAKEVKTEVKSKVADTITKPNSTILPSARKSDQRPPATNTMPDTLNSSVYSETNTICVDNMRFDDVQPSSSNSNFFHSVRERKQPPNRAIFSRQLEQSSTPMFNGVNSTHEMKQPIHNLKTMQLPPPVYRLNRDGNLELIRAPISNGATAYPPPSNRHHIPSTKLLRLSSAALPETFFYTPQNTVQNPERHGEYF